MYALDVDEWLLTELSHPADQQSLETITTLTGDARTMSRRLPEPVNTLLLANTLHGVDDPTVLVEQALDSLRPGGRFVVVNCEDRPREATRIAGEGRGPPTCGCLPRRPNKSSRTRRRSHTQTARLPPYHYGLVFET